MPEPTAPQAPEAPNGPAAPGDAVALDLGATHGAELAEAIGPAARAFLASLRGHAASPPGAGSGGGVASPSAETVRTWWTGSQPFPAARLRREMARLGATRALVWAPRRGAAQALPTPRQRELRGVVEGLGAAGFAVLEDLPDATYPALQRLVVQPTDLSCRFYRPGDEAAIVELFHQSFGPHRSIEHWRWKFAENPYRNHLISLVETEQGELAAHYGGFGVPMLRAALTTGGDSAGAHGEEMLAMQMGDTMTHPRFRAVGRRQTALLPRSVRHFFARHRSDELAFYFGFNRGPIQRFCRWFIGGDVVEPVGFWSRELPLEPSVATTAYSVTSEEPSTEWDALLRRALPDYGFLVRKDREYLDWRYCRCPDHDYVLMAVREASGRLVAWGVFRREGEALAWGDLLVERQHVGCLGALLRAALADLRLAGARRVEGWFSRHPEWLPTALGELGLRRGAHPQGLAMVALTNPPLEISDLRQLHTTWGDSDLF
ncbi:MAG: hypothetical protein DWQ36_05970 [Acidobacteria bacterium]|nr:MAG: hypothetical protein DWQ30_18975 [Acidobacteriota bacterium]REK09596.1 MAG: hypothetical protein DWQ36_05970 [Acidobacteriota bacterium]